MHAIAQLAAHAGDADDCRHALPVALSYQCSTMQWHARMCMCMSRHVHVHMRARANLEPLNLFNFFQESASRVIQTHCRRGVLKLKIMHRARRGGAAPLWHISSSRATSATAMQLVLICARQKVSFIGLLFSSQKEFHMHAPASKRAREILQLGIVRLGFAKLFFSASSNFTPETGAL